MALLSLDRLRPRTSPRGEVLTIGLVNNMPDKALKSTERQFEDLLNGAAAGRRFSLRVFSFPELARSLEARRHVAEHHEPIDALWDSELDGLIVTGAAPTAASVEQEPCWPTMTRLVDWAERHTASTIWSCLAAHAAVRHIDGVERRPLAGKLSGVFECARVDDDPLLALLPARWMTPHSRYNELPERKLRARGYRILSRSKAVGADVFVKRCGSLFVFLQGHPEYDALSLGREYRRDVGWFLAGRSETYPELPAAYFPPDVAAAMLNFRDAALRERDAVHLDSFPALPAVDPAWHGAATSLYAAWLARLAPRRSRRAGWAGVRTPAATTLTPTYA